MRNKGRERGKGCGNGEIGEERSGVGNGDMGEGSGKWEMRGREWGEGRCRRGVER